MFTPAGYRGIVDKRDRDEVWSRGTDLKCLINPRNLDASGIEFNYLGIQNKFNFVIISSFLIKLNIKNHYL